MSETFKVKESLLTDWVKVDSKQQIENTLQKEFWVGASDSFKVSEEIHKKALETWKNIKELVSKFIWWIWKFDTTEMSWKWTEKWWLDTPDSSIQKLVAHANEKMDNIYKEIASEWDSAINQLASKLNQLASTFKDVNTLNTAWIKRTY